MRTRLKVEDLRYIVKEEEGIVICLLTGELDLIRDREFDNFFISKNYTLINTKGIAKCSKEDKFDVSLGKRIAESKAKKAAFIQASLNYKNIADNIEKALDVAEELNSNCRFAAITEMKHLDELSK